MKLTINLRAFMTDRASSAPIPIAGARSRAVLCQQCAATAMVGCGECGAQLCDAHCTVWFDKESNEHYYCSKCIGRCDECANAAAETACCVCMTMLCKACSNGQRRMCGKCTRDFLQQCVRCRVYSVQTVSAACCARSSTDALCFDCGTRTYRQCGCGKLGCTNCLRTCGGAGCVVTVCPICSESCDKCKRKFCSSHSGANCSLNCRRVICTTCRRQPCSPCKRGQRTVSSSPPTEHVQQMVGSN